MKKIFISLGLLLALSFSANESFGQVPKYYFILFYYNSKDNTIRLDVDNKSNESLGLTNFNFTNDTGKGSQFYARVAKADGNFKLFPNGTKKFYLGHWEMWRFWDGIGKDGNPIGGSEELSEGNVQVSIPYFPDGTAINIYDAKTDQLKLSLDVSKFSGTGEFRNFSPDQSQPTESNNNLWMILAIVAGILFLGGGVVYFFLKKIFFKKTS